MDQRKNNLLKQVTDHAQSITLKTGSNVSQKKSFKNLNFKNALNKYNIKLTELRKKMQSEATVLFGSQENKPKADLSLGEDIFSKTLTNSYLPQGAFAAASSDKGLFAPLAMLDSQGSELPVSHSIGVFDSFGNQLATHDVESVVKSSADSEMLTPDIGTGIKIGAGYSSGGYALFPISELGYIDGGSLQSRVGSHF